MKSHEQKQHYVSHNNKSKFTEILSRFLLEIEILIEISVVNGTSKFVKPTF